MNKCICDVCGTENEMHYQYCKNCGAKLQKPINNENNTQYSHQQNNAYTEPQYTQYGQYTNSAEPFFNQTYGITEIEGIRTEDLAAYIGPQNKRIINKFSKMELSNSKVSWCWPAAAWGLLGVCGIALWFIYRKMYKLGIILLAIGVLLDSAVITLSSQGTNSFDSFASEIFSESIDDSEYYGLEEIPEIEEGNNSNKKSTVVGDIATIVGDIISLASIVLGGMFSMYAYKKHTINKIKHYNIVNASQRYHQIGLMAVGGTSAGIAVLAFFLSLVFQEIIERTILLLM